MNISYSKVELYTACPFKYYLQYVQKWWPNKTFTPLLFGSACDSAFNYILIRKKHHHDTYPAAKPLFLKAMKEWNGQNELCYFKNETPKVNASGVAFDELDDADKQWAVFDHLCIVGEMIIDTYISDILPQFKKIVSVQTKRIIPNEAGDNLVLITDFKAETQNGTEVTFDNKTSSDIKKYYGVNCVKKSQQLAIYTEYEPSRVAGYVAISKKLKDNKIDWKIVIDTIEEAQVLAVFTKIDNALNAIKNAEFPKNEKSCWQFARRCEFWDLCKKDDDRGLIKRC